MTLTTPISSGGRLRATTVCSAVPIWQAAMTGSSRCLGTRAVGALAGDRDVEEGTAGHCRAGGDREVPDRRSRPVVQAIDPVAREAIEQAVVEHREGAACAFLARLEDEGHRAVEIPRLGEVAGCAEQDRGVAVVAAGVHLALRAAGIGNPGRLYDRQRVHVGPDADRALAVAIAQHADDARAADAAMHLDAIALEFTRDDFGGAVGFEPEFGMGVQVASDRRQVGVKRANLVERCGRGHGKLASSGEVGVANTYTAGLAGARCGRRRRIRDGVDA